HLFHARGDRSNPYKLLSPRAPSCVRLETNRQAHARTSRGARSRGECIQLVDGNSAGLRVSLRNRQNHLRPVGLGRSATRHGRGLRISDLLGSVTPRLANFFRKRNKSDTGSRKRTSMRQRLAKPGALNSATPALPTPTALADV